MPNETQASILFVDDGPEILTALTRLLRSTDITVHTAISGEKGLQILEQQNIDIVVSDKNMPGMNGNEFLQKVAEQWPSVARDLYENQMPPHSVSSSAFFVGFNTHFQRVLIIRRKRSRAIILIVSALPTSR